MGNVLGVKVKGCEETSKRGCINVGGDEGSPVSAPGSERI